jgi:flagellar motor switch protein FliG
MSETASKPLTKTQRAAVLLMTLGEQEAADVLRQLGAQEVQKLGLAMATISNVSKSQVVEVVGEFVDTLDQQTSLGMGADAYVRNVLTQALGEGKANALIDRILLGRNTKGLETLKWMEPRAIADLVRNEHPQIVAIVLAYLDSDQAAEVLKQLAPRMRSEVLMRIATLDGIPPSALSELNEIMERQFAGQANMPSSNVGGIKVTANILNFIDAQTEQQIMSGICEVDADLGAKIQELMFVFDDIGGLDDKSIQIILKDVPSDKLGLALRGAEGKVKDKFTKNMSQRASSIMLEDMEARGPVRLSDVEAAQKEILAIVRGLIDSGAVAGGGKGEDFI